MLGVQIIFHPVKHIIGTIMDEEYTELLAELCSIFN